MPLLIVQSGRTVTLLEVRAEPGLQGRLAAMGLIPGVEIEVLQNVPRGPFMISVKGSRVMLGRAVASQIVVA